MKESFHWKGEALIWEMTCDFVCNHRCDTVACTSLNPGACFEWCRDYIAVICFHLLNSRMEEDVFWVLVCVVLKCTTIHCGCFFNYGLFWLCVFIDKMKYHYIFCLLAISSSCFCIWRSWMFFFNCQLLCLITTSIMYSNFIQWNNIFLHSYICVVVWRRFSAT